MQVLDYIILGLKIIAGVVAIPAIGGWLIAKIDALIVSTKDARRKMMLEWLKEGMVFRPKRICWWHETKSRVTKANQQPLTG